MEWSNIKDGYFCNLMNGKRTYCIRTNAPNT